MEVLQHPRTVDDLLHVLILLSYPGHCWISSDERCESLMTNEKQQKEL